MAFRLLPRQFAISVHNGLHGLSKAHASLIERALLNVAPRQLLDVSDPPVADLLEHAGITVLHTPLFSHQRAGDTSGTTDARAVNSRGRSRADTAPSGRRRR